MIWQKIKYKLKWGLRDIQSFFGVSFSTKIIDGGVRVLCFHGVCRDEQSYINARFLKESHLKKLLIAIKNHFNIIDLETYLNGKYSQEKLNILLTFDDGYKNNKTLLLPIIEELKIPVTLFVLARENMPLWPDLIDIIFDQQKQKLLQQLYGIDNKEKFKSWIHHQPTHIVESVTDELKIIAQPFLADYKEFWETLSKEELILLNEHPLVTLCNHTANHYNLLSLDQKQLKEEVEVCSQFLKEINAKFPDVLAFPYGFYNAELCSTLDTLNYHVRFSITEGINTDEKAINRLVINPFISIRNQLISIVNGKY